MRISDWSSDVCSSDLRESLGSTAIGHGVAIPHARSNAFSAARGAFLRLEHPVDFGARDHAPVDLVFAMSVPEHSSQQYLEILSELNSTARRVGKESVSTCRSRWSP